MSKNKRPGREKKSGQEAREWITVISNLLLALAAVGTFIMLLLQALE
jgi:hypothetical protein